MRFIAWTGALVSIILLAISCGGDPNAEVNQREAIIKYMESKRLEYTEQRGVFKHVGNIGREGRDKEPQVEKGDSVWLYFVAQTFLSSQISAPYYTNIKIVADKMEGLDTRFWSLDPLEAKVGHNSLMEGLNRGLPQCRQGDSVLLFIPSELGYGDKIVSVVDKNATLVYTVMINKIKK